jgi:hypothetical protein
MTSGRTEWMIEMLHTGQPAPQAGIYRSPAGRELMASCGNVMPPEYDGSEVDYILVVDLLTVDVAAVDVAAVDLTDGYVIAGQALTTT